MCSALWDNTEFGFEALRSGCACICFLHTLFFLFCLVKIMLNYYSLTQRKLVKLTEVAILQKAG